METQTTAWQIDHRHPDPPDKPLHAPTPGEQVLLTLAVVGPAHAFKGEACLKIRAGDPGGRLVPGTTVLTESAHADPLTVSRLRFDNSYWFVIFEQARDRAVAEALRGVRPPVETDDDQGGEGHDEGHEVSEGAWCRHELVGLRALSVSGEELREVTDVEPGVAQDRPVVTTPEGDDVAMPFIKALVPAIDPEAGAMTLAPPDGLFLGRGQMEEAR